MDIMNFVNMGISVEFHHDAIEMGTSVDNYRIILTYPWMHRSRSPC